VQEGKGTPATTAGQARDTLTRLRRNSPGLEIPDTGTFHGLWGVNTGPLLSSDCRERMTDYFLMAQENQGPTPDSLSKKKSAIERQPLNGTNGHKKSLTQIDFLEGKARDNMKDINQQQPGRLSHQA